MKKKKLSEDDWNKVFKLRCQSKSGHELSQEQSELCRKARKEDPERYKGMDNEVFERTKPFGA